MTKTSKTNIANLIESNKGKIISISYTKNDGTEKKVNGIFHNKTALGYILIKDMVAARKKDEDNLFDTIDPKKIKSITLNKEVYTSK